MDLAVVYTDRPGVLYRDRLAGKYEAIPLEVIPQGTSAIGAFDVNNDGWTDLIVGDSLRLALLMNDHNGGLQHSAAPAGARTPFVFADLENRTVSELVAGGGVFRNSGLGAFELVLQLDGVEAAAVKVPTAGFALA
jgi:hypothetical protein